jgi:hypothetical protein
MFDAASSRNRYCRRLTFRFGQVLPFTMTTSDSSSASQYGRKMFGLTRGKFSSPSAKKARSATVSAISNSPLGSGESGRSSGLSGSRMKYAAPTRPENTLSRVIPIAWSW